MKHDITAKELANLTLVNEEGTQGTKHMPFEASHNFHGVAETFQNYNLENGIDHCSFTVNGDGSKAPDGEIIAEQLLDSLAKSGYRIVKER